MTAPNLDHLREAFEQNEREWSTLEAASEAVPATHGGSFVWRDYSSTYEDRRPKYADRPHPDSYGADLPMRGRMTARGFPVIPALTPEEKRYLASRAARPAAPSPASKVRPNSAHPDSYGADLPLRGLGLGNRKKTAKWTLTAAEKAVLAARPLKWNR